MKELFISIGIASGIIVGIVLSILLLVGFLKLMFFLFGNAGIFIVIGLILFSMFVRAIHDYRMHKAKYRNFIR